MATVNNPIVNLLFSNQHLKPKPRHLEGNISTSPLRTPTLTKNHHLNNQLNQRHTPLENQALKVQRKTPAHTNRQDKREPPVQEPNQWRNHPTLNPKPNL